MSVSITRHYADGRCREDGLQWYTVAGWLWWTHVRINCRTRRDADRVAARISRVGRAIDADPSLAQMLPDGVYRR